MAHSTLATFSAETAVCEGCGCTWENACQPFGCAWDQVFWNVGRAVCTECVRLNRVPPELVHLSTRRGHGVT
jgi:hypothetical protein